MGLEGLATKKVLATAVMAVLALSILSLSVPALSQNQENEEEQKVEVSTEVSVKVEGNEIEVEVEVEGIEDGEYEVAFDCETKPEVYAGAILSGTLIVADGKGEVELEGELVAGSYADCAITFGDFSETVASFTIAEAEVEEEEEGEAKGEAKAKAAQARAETKAKAALERAEKARASAEAKGRAEVVDNINKAERYFGKLDKAVVGLKIALSSENAESMSFGSAQLILIKLGDREPMFRAVIHVLTDQPVESMTACLDGDKIGEFEVIHTSSEAGMTIGHMRESLVGKSITIPGVTVHIFEGADCAGTSIATGSV